MSRGGKRRRDARQGRVTNGRRSGNERPTVRSSSRIGTGPGRLWEFRRRSATLVRSFSFAALSIHKTNQPPPTHTDNTTTLPPPPLLSLLTIHLNRELPERVISNDALSPVHLVSFPIFSSPPHPNFFFSPTAHHIVVGILPSSFSFYTKYKWNGNQEHGRPPYSHTVPRSQLQATIV